MESMQKSYTLHISGKGFLRGITKYELATNIPKCHCFRGVPYAVPMTKAHRWRRAMPLSKDTAYGTKENPADFTGLCAESPQIGPYNALLMTEDCLQCNIWIPIGVPPQGGWPVWIYIHGGFLQWGSPNREDASSLLSHTNVQSIIIAPTYRLNVFGFLASHELQQEASANGSTYGNLGFWDQRLAIEWTFENIEGFGGNKNNITTGGLSAGAYSTFHQLAYELALPDSQAIIRRVVLFSNGPGLPPKPLHELQSHFDLLLDVLHISRELDAKNKLELLRSLPYNTLLEAVHQLPENAFRAVTDGAWVRHSLFDEIEDGRFAKAMLRRGTKIMIGDLPDENNVYKMVQPPTSYDSLVLRLSIEYPEVMSKKLAKLYCPGHALPSNTTWQEVFGHIYADMQVHVTERGFLAALARKLPLSYIHRYRINWRPKCVEEFMPLDMGVSHGSDLTIWFFGNGRSLLPEEQNLVRRFLKPFAAFLRGEEYGYGTGSIAEVWAIQPDMSIAIVRDADWQRCQRIWRCLHMNSISRM